MPKRSWLVMPLVLAACSQGEAPADTQKEEAAAPSSYFRAEIAPILQSSCATCHLTSAEAGNMSLIPAKAIATLVGVKSVGAPKFMRVAAGDPDASHLVMKLVGTHIKKGGVGAQMPFGAPPLSPEKIAKIKQWIKDGAKE